MPSSFLPRPLPLQEDGTRCVSERQGKCACAPQRRGNAPGPAKLLEHGQPKGAVHDWRRARGADPHAASRRLSKSLARTLPLTLGPHAASTGVRRSESKHSSASTGTLPAKASSRFVRQKGPSARAVCGPPPRRLRTAAPGGCREPAGQGRTHSWLAGRSPVLAVSHHGGPHRAPSHHARARLPTALHCAENARRPALVGLLHWARLQWEGEGCAAAAHFTRSLPRDGRQPPCRVKQRRFSGQRGGAAQRAGQLGAHPALGKAGQRVRPRACALRRLPCRPAVPTPLTAPVSFPLPPTLQTQAAGW